MSNLAAAYLWDARRAAERIGRFVAGRTYDEYVADEMLRSAVERQFEIIGEAFVSLRRAAPEVASELPDLARIIAFRNVLVHSYRKIDDDLVWSATQSALPPLVVSISALLDEFDRSMTAP